MHCQCGCGELAPIAKMTNRRLGHVQGQPVRFVQGHHRRLEVALKPKPEPRLCECGCGKFTRFLKGRPQRFVFTHYKNRAPLSPERIAAMNTPDVIARRSQCRVGLKHSPERCAAIGNGVRGKMAGAKHPRWKGGASYQNRGGNGRYLAWTLAVKRRDNYSCQRCGYRSYRGMHAHHILGWTDYPVLRYETWNGETMCRACHEAHHAKRPALTSAA